MPRLFSLTVGAALAAVAVMVCLVSFAEAQVKSADPGLLQELSLYAGSKSCIECHGKIYQLWATSRHGLAMQPYTAAFARANLDHAGKAIGINLFIGKRPYAAFGNSGGDREMLELTQAGNGTRLMMLVLHGDQNREYAYGPAEGLPDTKVGAFSQALMAEAQKRGWFVISMKKDLKKVFAWE